MSWTEYLPQLRILAKRRFGHWTAWFAHAPQEAFGSDNPREAITRLLEAHPEYDIDRKGLRLSNQLVDGNCIEITVVLHGGSPCRECKGTGKYVGLQNVEDCRACGGSGKTTAAPRITAGEFPCDG